MTRNWQKISGRKVAMMLTAAVVGFGTLGAAPAKADMRDRFDNRRPVERFDRRDDHRDFDRDHRDGGRLGISINLGGQNAYLSQRQFVPAVYEDRPVQVWVEPVYRTECNRVWVEPVVQKVCEKVWVPDRYEDRIVQRRHGWRIIEECERVLVEPGHYVEQWRDVVVRPGHWENVERQVVAVPGHYETRIQRVEVCAAHWEDRPVVGINW